MERQNSSSKVYDSLECAILLGKLKPHQRLVERDLVAELGVSRTPVREALSRLKAVGLVRPEGRRGLVVRDFTRQEILDLYFLRETLERAAVKLIFKHLTPADVKEAELINEQFRRACRRLDLRTMIETNNAFHQRLLEITQNQFLIRALEEIRLKVFLFRYSLWSDPQTVQGSIRDHDEMLKALREGHQRRFERLVVRHMNVAKQAYLARHFWG